MDDQSMAEGTGWLACPSSPEFWTPGPTAVVAWVNHIRWIRSGGWGHFAVGERR